MRKLRHYWNSSKFTCDCGCTKRVIIAGQWICVEKVKDELRKQGVDLNE